MGQTLTEIAQALKDANKKVLLIYAFNGTGKTRLSREFKELIASKDEVEDGTEDSGIKTLYYNAFTEDLFYWDNDLATDTNRKLKIHPNKFTDWVLRVQGQGNNIITHFQHYTNDKLTPYYNEKYDEVTFSIEGGNEQNIKNIKISKGEESCLIWCVFYSLLEQVVENLNIPEPAERDTNRFNDLEYIFIDDPVSSLDDNHLIELAVNLAELIKSSPSSLHYIITTHNPLFYNVLFNEFRRTKRASKYKFNKLDDGTYLLDVSEDSPFSYHLSLLSELEKAAQSGDVKKYHFNLLRNILEKASTFLGYEKWEDLLPKESRSAYYERILNISSHSKHHGEETSIVKDEDKRVLSYLLPEIKKICGFKQGDNNNVNEQ